MAVRNPYNNYANNAISTASKEKMTLMLYEGALKFANQALIALEAKNYEKMNMSVHRVLDIVRELQVTLDRQYEISNNLYVLYDYMHSTLITANISKDHAAMEEIRDYLREFRDVWKEAMALAKKQ